MALAAGTALVSVIALGEYIFYRGWTQGFLRDELAELDARLDRQAQGEPEAPEEEVPDEVALHGESSIRFWLWFVLVAGLHIFTTNTIGGGFLQQYSHPGVALVHMRNDDPQIRREGLGMLAARLDFRVTPAVEEVVLNALRDADEGVAARAAFVIGALSMEAAADDLARIAVERPALTFTALISLGQVGSRSEAARTAARRLAKTPEARAEPRALAYLLGLLRVPEIELLRSIHAQAADDEETRIAAVWALGELREPRLLDFMASALKDESLGVRCAAVIALENMVVFEASDPLRAEFERVKDPLLTCPEVNIPVQEGGPKMPVVPYRNYQLALIRALATTDDPRLLQWLVEHQDGVESRTHELMRAKWEDLKKKEADGKLNQLKQRIRARRLQEEIEEQGGTIPLEPAGPDAGAAGAAPGP